MRCHLGTVTKENEPYEAVAFVSPNGGLTCFLFKRFFKRETWEIVRAVNGNNNKREGAMCPLQASLIENSFF